MKKKQDPLHDFLRSLGSRRGIVPPFALELALVDGMFYYVHSVEDAAEGAVSITVRVWDTRSLSDEELGRLRKRIDSITDAAELADPAGLHPKLDWGVLRIDLDQISYCVEWHHRLWPVKGGKDVHQNLH